VSAEEIEPLPLTADEEAAWRALARVLVALPKLMDGDLMQHTQLTLNEYSVLMFLSEAPDRALRMSQLADMVQISFSGLTRLVERLERSRMVERVRSDSDGRGNRAVLTEDGLDRLRSAWPEHLRSVRRVIMDHLQGLDLPAFATALNSMIDNNASGGRRAPGGRARPRDA
jgi:DNA-binding MarR family transcriptional regulator